MISSILTLGVFLKFLPEDYEKLANAITLKVARKLKTDKDLCLIGIVGGMMDDIKMMGMAFEYSQSIDVKRGRELLLFSISEYLAAINGDEKVRSYLHTYPFTVKDVEIKIHIRNPDGSIVSPENIYYISSINGELCYYLNDPEYYSRICLLQETYEEAMQALKSEG